MTFTIRFLRGACRQIFHYKILLIVGLISVIH